MGKLERYTSYKDSGVDWIGEIPTEWNTKKLKFIGKMFAGLTDKKGDDFSKEESQDKERFIPFTNICNNLKIDKNQMQFVKIKPFEKQNKVQKNDIIFLMSSETLDDIGKCSIHLHNEKFYLNSFCKGYRPKLNEINPEFLNYLLQSKTYRNYFSLVGRGFTRINIKQDYITNLSAILPLTNEQSKIAEYLDNKTNQIDNAISQKEKLIELLKEQKQITINDTVTKGLNKDIEFIDSSVEWIGNIPKHWKLERLGSNFIERKEKVSDKDFEPLSVTKNGIVPQLDSAAKSNDGDNRKLVRNGDFVINSRSDRKGSSGLSTLDGSVSLINIVLKPIKIEPKFSHHVFKSYKFIEEFYRNGHGIVADLWTTRFWDMKSIMLAIPPKDEQIQIIEYIEKQTTKIDKAIELQQNYISKLKEYKASLIDSVVTGKVRVS